jgi:hypothetical protein
MSLTQRLTAALAAAGLLLTAAPAFAADMVKTNVTVMRVGQDDTSKAFGDVIAQTFAASPAFAFVTENFQVKVQLDAIDTPPTGEQGAFTFKVEITLDGGQVTVLSANCYVADMADCASLIVDRTYSAVQRAHPAESKP